MQARFLVLRRWRHTTVNGDDRRAQLLLGPVCTGMIGDVDIQVGPTQFHENEYTPRHTGRPWSAKSGHETGLLCRFLS